MRYPDVPTTPEQWSVIAWSVIAILAALGVVAIYYSTGAAVAHPDAAQQLRHVGLDCWGLAIFIYVLKRVITYIMS